MVPTAPFFPYEGGSYQAARKDNIYSWSKAIRNCTIGYETHTWPLFAADPYYQSSIHGQL
jgi:hypothetical protein